MQLPFGIADGLLDFRVSESSALSLAPRTHGTLPPTPAGPPNRFGSPTITSLAVRLSLLEPRRRHPHAHIHSAITRRRRPSTSIFVPVTGVITLPVGLVAS